MESLPPRGGSQDLPRLRPTVNLRPLPYPVVPVLPRISLPGVLSRDSSDSGWTSSSGGASRVAGRTPQSRDNVSRVLVVADH